MSIDDEKKKVVLANDLVAGVLATTVLGVGVVLHLPVIAAVGAAAAVYGGMRLLLPSALRNREEMDSITRDSIARGRQQIGVMQQLAAATKKESVRQSVNNICASATEIFSMFESAPHKAPLARGFVDYTITRTVNILQRYQELSRRAGNVSAQETLAKTETLLSMIEQSFHEQVARLLSEDVADLDSEIEILKTRLEVEGETEP
jgi:5-bromo-4-chloroindolyl phosphate hydrolysis protein